MPIYEYVCTECGTKFGAVRSIKQADDPITCEKCQSKHTKRVQSTFYSHVTGQSASQAQSGCSGCTANSCDSCPH